ncbi:MAG: PKD domain-containing protein, partial [Xanthomonadales bacterium]|nr:PKD domain-containing protein [Xanthomonadales bacterium]
MKALLAAMLLAAGATNEPRLTIPSIDQGRLLAEDVERVRDGLPVRYAVPFKLDDLTAEEDRSAEGEWVQLDDGSWEWTLFVTAANATSLDFGFEDFWFPRGARLVVESADGKLLAGPFTDDDNRSERQLWTPVVRGNQARLRVTVSDALRPFVSFRLAQVNAGYRLFNPLSEKSQSCNIDVVCPEGDDYRDEVRSVALITVGGSGGFCTGQLLNKTGTLDKAYFLTANHCGITAQEAPSLVFYFNYQSDTCRSGSASGSSLPLSIGDPVTGATLVANHGPRADFMLLELDELPADPINVFYAGWDRRDVPPTSAAIIHHAQGDEKRIAREFDPVVDGDERFTVGDVDLATGRWWQVREWDVGITEGGSSGGGLFDQNGRVVGQLAGGFSFTCPGAEEGFDAFGKFSESWNGGGAPATRLSDWLDPGATGARFVDGVNGCDGPTVDILGPEGPIEVGELVNFTAEVSGGQAPYSYSWDLDGDGAMDSPLATFDARFKHPGSLNVALTVSDASGCPVRARFGVPVLAPSLELTDTADPVEVCGDGDAALERGEVWRFPARITNNGDVPALNALAAFAVAEAPAAGKRLAGPDGFGYVARDTSEGFCAFEAMDISGTGTTLAPDDDDDGAAQVELADGVPFDFYGEALASVSMSTNGYLAADLDDGGTDFGNDCPLPRSFGGDDRRILPLHDDLVVEGGLYHQHFEDCPRPDDAGPGSQACDVFQWDDMRYFSSSGERFDFQAILYRDSFNLVYQYGPGNPRPGESSTTGIQNAGGNIGLTY